MLKKKLEPLILNGAVERHALQTSQVPSRNGSAYRDDGDGSLHAANGSSLNARDLFNIGDDLPIIVHCHLRWDFVWQRPQQIFSRLAAQHPITFIEEPIWQGNERRLEISEPYPNVVRLVPVLRADEKNHDTDSQYEAVLPLLRRALSEHSLLRGRVAAPIQWFYSPISAPYFLDGFNAAATVYDCMDELAQFRFAPPSLREREELLLSRADVVFTGGYRLFQSKSRYHSNVHFYGCGVDAEHFSKARQRGTRVPAEVAALPRPILGYFGVIDERLDYALLAQIAQEMPDASIVMVGPLAKVEQESLPNFPNIHWLGQRAYTDLPALVKSFDVCLMPFALNDATQYINPTKTLEYMAAGKPVVSTAVPDVLHHFTPIVDVALTAEEFIAAIHRAARSTRAELIEQGIDRANRASWDSIVSAMRGHMLDSVRADLSAPTWQSAFP
jgi:glycosyltransferase involved in cell wall biosynthesis